MGLSQDPGARVICEASGKERLSKGAAKSAAKRVRRYPGQNIVAYRCRTCRGWHVGARRIFSA